MIRPIFTSDFNAVIGADSIDGIVIIMLFSGMGNVRKSLYRILEITKPGEALVFLSHATALRRNGLLRYGVAF